MIWDNVFDRFISIMLIQNHGLSVIPFPISKMEKMACFGSCGASSLILGRGGSGGGGEFFILSAKN